MIYLVRGVARIGLWWRRSGRAERRRSLLLAASGIAIMTVNALLTLRPGGPPSITLAESRRIRPGMTLSEVEAIIGPGGKRSDFDTGEVYIVQWENPNGSRLIAVLSNNRLVSSHVDGLP